MFVLNSYHPPPTPVAVIVEATAQLFHPCDPTSGSHSNRAYECVYTLEVHSLFADDGRVIVGLIEDKYPGPTRKQSPHETSTFFLSSDRQLKVYPFENP